MRKGWKEERAQRRRSRVLLLNELGLCLELERQRMVVRAVGLLLADEALPYIDRMLVQMVRIATAKMLREVLEGRRAG